jgi:hypothetical protein
VSFTVETTVLPSFAQQRDSKAKVGTARPLASQTSAAKQRFFWMQWRLCRANGSATARRPYPGYAAARFVSWEGSSSSHDPFFSREAASEGSMTVSVVQAACVAWAVLAGRCLAVIPHLPRLIFGPCQPKHWEVRRKHIADGPKGAASRGRARQRMALPMGFSREAA